MKTRAAILVALNRPLEVVDLEIPALAAGQVLVQVVFSGVCRSQILEARGHRGADPYLPHGLGHEGSGIVREVGPGVTRVKPGDRVVLSWIKGPGADVLGTKYVWNDKIVNAGGITTFMDHAVVSENRLSQFDAAIPWDQAALLGCAIPTGIGTVFNSAQVRPGQSVAVFGVGGVGLWAVSGAAVSGASPVIAIDLRSEKLALAQQLGATHTICAETADPVREILQICASGVDVAIEASGRPAVMQQALDAVRPQGGIAVIAGNARHEERWTIDPKQLNQGKRIVGTWGGDNVPERDFPRYQRLLRNGKLTCIGMHDRRYSLDEINQALDDLEAGRAVRPLIELSAPNG